MNLKKMTKWVSAGVLALMMGAGTVQAGGALAQWPNSPGPGGDAGAGTGLDYPYSDYRLSSFGSYSVTLSNLTSVAASGYKFVDFKLTFGSSYGVGALTAQSWNDGFMTVTGVISGSTETVDFSVDNANLANQPTVIFTTPNFAPYNAQGMNNMTVTALEVTPEPGTFALVGFGLALALLGRKSLLRRRTA